jgi:hypothetical protein
MPWSTATEAAPTAGASTATASSAAAKNCGEPTAGGAQCNFMQDHAQYFENYGTQAPVSYENGVLVGRSQVWKPLSRGRIRSAM